MQRKRTATEPMHTSSPCRHVRMQMASGIRRFEGRQASASSARTTQTDGTGYAVTLCTPASLDGPSPKPARVGLYYAPGETIGSDRSHEGRCEPHLVYDVMSLGKAAVGAFVSRVRGDQVLLHPTAQPGPADGALHRVSGLIEPGNVTHLLSLSVDDQQQVGESNESNNKARVMVEVRNCGQTQPGRAPLRTPTLPQ